MNEISVDIERLVLNSDAFETSDGKRVARAVEQSLRQLLEQSGLPSASSAVDASQRAAPDVSLNLNMSVEQKGRAVAVAIYRALGSSEVKL